MPRNNAWFSLWRRLFEAFPAAPFFREFLLLALPAIAGLVGAAGLDNPFNLVTTHPRTTKDLARDEPVVKQGYLPGSLLVAFPMNLCQTPQELQIATQYI